MAFKRLYYVKEIVKFEIAALRQYLEENLNSIRSKQESLHGELNKTLETIDDKESEQHFIDQFLDNSLIYFEGFPKYFNDSTYLIFYSFFEANLAKVARIAKTDLNTHNKKKITASPANNYAHGSKDFLTKHCLLKIKAKENIWKKLNKLRDYRNFIAHNNSHLKQTGDATSRAKKKNTVNYINRVFGKCISTDDLGQCHIENPKLLISMLDLVETYLFFVIDKTMKKCK